MIEQHNQYVPYDGTDLPHVRGGRLGELVAPHAPKEQLPWELSPSHDPQKTTILRNSCHKAIVVIIAVKGRCGGIRASSSSGGYGEG